MPLLHEVETLDSVDEKYRGLYSENGNGKFHLDENVREDTSSLKTALDAERQNKKALEDRLKAFDGIDPAQVKLDLEKAEAERVEALKKSGNIDALLEEQKKAFDTQNGTLQGQIDNLSNQLTRRDLDDKFKQTALLQHARPEGTEYILTDAKAAGLQLKDGQVSILDESGNPKLSADGSVLTQEKWLEDHRKQKAFLYKESSGGGTPPGGGSGGGGQTEITRTQYDTMSLIEQSTAMKAGAKVVD